MVNICSIYTSVVQKHLFYLSLFIYLACNDTLLHSLRAENIIVEQKITGTLLTLALWDCFYFSFERYPLARLVLKPNQQKKKDKKTKRHHLHLKIRLLRQETEAHTAIEIQQLREKGLVGYITKISLLTIFSLH